MNIYDPTAILSATQNNLDIIENVRSDLALRDLCLPVDTHHNILMLCHTSEKLVQFIRDVYREYDGPRMIREGRGWYGPPNSQ